MNLLNWKPAPAGGILQGGAGPRFLLRAFVSLLCLAWVAGRLPRMGMEEAAGVLLGVRPAALGGAMALAVALLLTRMLRLAFWAGSLGGGSLRPAAWVDLYLRSTALGAVTPARIGDFSRIALLAGTGLALGVRARLALLEKVADALYLPLGLMAAAPAFAVILPAGTGNLRLLAVALLGMQVAGYFFLRGALRWGAAFSGLGVTLLGFGLYCGLNVLLFQAAGAQLPACAVIVAAVGSGLVAALPVSAGGLGLREGSLVVILERFGVDPQAMVAVVCCELLVNLVLPLGLFAGWRLVAGWKTHGCGVS